ncbi:hypothetical protein FHS95_002617 [Sphingomonas naasensis]|nr:hypothetical protein [Sphingomonas naasensis]
MPGLSVFQTVRWALPRAPTSGPSLQEGSQPYPAAVTGASATALVTLQPQTA